ncbi:MAG: hypothetical protein EOP06_28155, partial [Proteobacteria bacterium]
MLPLSLISIYTRRIAVLMALAPALIVGSVPLSAYAQAAKPNTAAYRATPGYKKAVAAYANKDFA